MSESVLDLSKRLAGLVGRNFLSLIRKALLSGYDNSKIILLFSIPSIWKGMMWVHQNIHSFQAWFGSLNGIMMFIKNLFRKKRDEIKPSSRPAIGSDYLESVIEGSKEIESPHRKGEVFILNEKKEAVGKGFRLYDALIAPEHVIEAAKAIGGRVYIGSIKNGKTYDITGFDHILLYTDVLAIDLDMPIWADLGTAKISVGCLDKTALVTITGITGRGTTSRLENAPSLGFGIVRYHGTTRNGYSGALYANGEHALAMHMSGGNANKGIAIDLIRALFKTHVKMVNGVELEAADIDSSVKWAENEWFDRKGGLMKGVKAEMQGLDQVRVFYRGRYAVMEKEILKQLGDRYNVLMYEDAESVFPMSPNYGALGRKTPVPVPRTGQSSNGILKSQERLPELVDVSLSSQSKSLQKKVKWLQSMDESQLRQLLQASQVDQSK